MGLQELLVCIMILLFRNFFLYKNLKNGISTNLRLADFTDNLDLIFRIGDFEIVSFEYPGKMTVDNGDPTFVPDTAAAISALLKYRS